MNTTLVKKGSQEKNIFSPHSCLALKSHLKERKKGLGHFDEIWKIIFLEAPLSICPAIYYSYKQVYTTFNKPSTILHTYFVAWQELHLHRQCFPTGPKDYKGALNSASHKLNKQPICDEISPHFKKAKPFFLKKICFEFCAPWKTEAKYQQCMWCLWKYFIVYLFISPFIIFINNLRW